MCIIRFGLTPAQREELPLEVDTWLLPTALAYDKITGGPPAKRPGRH